MQTDYSTYMETHSKYMTLYAAFSCSYHDELRVAPIIPSIYSFMVILPVLAKRTF